MVMLSLAWRNLLRNRRRSLMTLLAMVLGMMAVLLFGGYVRDLVLGMQTDFVKRTGHLQIQHRDYFHYGTGNPAAYGIKDYEQVVQALQGDAELAPMLTVVTPTLQFSGIAGNFAASVSRTVIVNGVVVDDQVRLREWNDYQQRDLSKRLSLAGTTPDTVVIGTGVARVLKLCGALRVADCQTPAEPGAEAPAQSKADELATDIADLAQGETPAQAPSPGTSQGAPRIELLAAGLRGAPNVTNVQIMNAEFQGIKELDDVYVGMHLAQAQRLLYGSLSPQVTAIVVQLRHTSQIPVARARIEKLLASRFSDRSLAALDFETLNPFYGQTISMFGAILGFVAILIGAIVLFTISNTMSMAVMERTAEIGTLRAIGLRRDGIKMLFILEGVILGMVGAAAGVACALAAAGVINQMNLSWIPPGRIEPVALSVQLSSEFLMMAGASLVLVMVAALSATLPALRGARLNIVDALRHV
jgi:putative ABC transport system permease protein